MKSLFWAVLGSVRSGIVMGGKNVKGFRFRLGLISVCFSLVAMLGHSCQGVSEESLEKIEKENDAKKKAQAAKKKPAKKKNLTLAQIKNKYGNVTQVITNLGKTYIGYFKSQGGWMTIITPKGTVKIKQTKVKQIKPYP